MNNASNWKPGAPDINNFVVLDIAVSHVTIRTRMNHFRALLFVGIALFLAFVLGMISKRSLTDIIDIHEHIESLAKAEEFLRAMDAEGIARAVLLPSPIETITLNGNKSFTGHEENMEEIFRIAKKYPNRFIPFCTISPLDADPLAILKSCVEKGGKGLKLYNGHSYYYDVFGAPLDTPSMMPVYAYAQQEGIPVIYHVNINRYGEELERVLSAYPDLRVLVPHFMISSVDITRVEYFFRATRICLPTSDSDGNNSWRRHSGGSARTTKRIGNFLRNIATASCSVPTWCSRRFRGKTRAI